jgi:hypothetical protein
MGGYQCFKEMYCLSLQDRSEPSWKVMGYIEEARGEETGVNNQSHRSGHCYPATRLCHAVHFNIMQNVFKKCHMCCNF